MLNEKPSRYMALRFQSMKLPLSLIRLDQPPRLLSLMSLHSKELTQKSVLTSLLSLHLTLDYQSTLVRQLITDYL